MAHDKALPVCDNDWDFKLLRQQCCNGDFEPDGPYDAEGNSVDDDGLSFLRANMRAIHSRVGVDGIDDSDGESDEEVIIDEDEFYI